MSLKKDFLLNKRLESDTFFIEDLPLCKFLLMNDSNYPWFLLVPRINGIKELNIQNKENETIAKFDTKNKSIYLGGSNKNNSPLFIHNDKVYIDNLNIVRKNADGTDISNLDNLASVNEKDNKQLPINDVCRFHLGNGAIIDDIIINANVSEVGLNRSFGVMVNYLYELKNIEKNHEEYINNKTIIISDKLKKII